MSSALVAALLALPLLAVVGSARPTSAAAEPDLDVTITAVSPSRLSKGDIVTMSGTVTNRDDHVWGDAQAYLVVPRSPFTTRKQVEDAIASGAVYTGERVIDLKSIDELGDLEPGRTVEFQVKVPYRALNVSGTQGVYPMGIQILGTDVDGTRDAVAIGRATTFLPLVTGSRPLSVSASIVWPFLMPTFRKIGGDYADAAELVELVSRGGRLRNQLDLARSVRARGSTPIIDPALLVGLDDISRGRHLPDDLSLTDAERETVTRFFDDLVALAQRDATWVLGFDRPDVLAITQSSDAGALSAAVERATASTLDRYQLSGRRVAWPTEGGVTGPLLSALRGNGEQAVVVPSSSLPDWEPRDGSLVEYQARSGPMPVLVDDALDSGVPGSTTIVTLRQRLLSEAALASLQRRADPESRADAVALVDPLWDPGPVGGEAQLDAVFDAPFVAGAGLEDVLNQPLSSYDGATPRTAKVRAIRARQVAAAASAADTATLLGEIMPDSADAQAARARDIASVLGVRWRAMRDDGLVAARTVARRSERDLGRITVDGPDGVTLSSSAGSFPVTLTNDTEHPVRIAVAIESSNPSLSVEPSGTVDVDAGERRTLTIAVDMGRQTSATLTARMVTADGQSFGEPAVFNVRSSRVGAALWVAIGLAAAFVVFTLVRRFRGRRAKDESGVRDRPILESDPDD